MPLDPATALPVRTLTLGQPCSWLVRGWGDLRRSGSASWVHGLAVALFGQLLLWLAHDRFWLLAGAFSGLLVVAPVLATGLYAISRAFEKHERSGFALVWRTWLSWRRHGPAGRKDWRLVRFGLLLALAGTGWVLTSAALITLLSPEAIRAPVDFLRHIVLARDHFLFELWLAVGGVMAAPIFASSVVALPLMVDRRVSLLQALVTSWECVLSNPASMALWAALILLLTFLGMVTGLLGLIVVIPLLGHASWHAYRDLVDASACPERESTS